LPSRIRVCLQAYHKSPTIFPGFSRCNSLSPGNRKLVLHRTVRNLQPLVDDRKCLAQLRLVDAQRRISEESIPANEGIEPVLSEELAERNHFIGRAIERRHGLPCLTIPDQLDDAEQPDRTYCAHRPVFRL